MCLTQETPMERAAIIRTKKNLLRNHRQMKDYDANSTVICRRLLLNLSHPLCSFLFLLICQIHFDRRFNLDIFLWHDKRRSILRPLRFQDAFIWSLLGDVHQFSDQSFIECVDMCLVLGLIICNDRLSLIRASQKEITTKITNCFVVFN